MNKNIFQIKHGLFRKIRFLFFFVFLHSVSCTSCRSLFVLAARSGPPQARRSYLRREKARPQFSKGQWSDVGLKKIKPSRVVFGLGKEGYQERGGPRACALGVPDSSAGRKKTGVADRQSTQPPRRR